MKVLVEKTPKALIFKREHACNYSLFPHPYEMVMFVLWLVVGARAGLTVARSAIHHLQQLAPHFLSGIFFTFSH